MTGTAVGTPLARAAAIAERVVAPAAHDVDVQARFPSEAFEALRAERLMGIAIAVEDGGEGASWAEVGRVIEVLGRACASTAMVYAMHQIQVACLINYASTPGLKALRAAVASDQLLLGSATTEIGIGGDVRSSSCHVAVEGERYSLVKNAPVISYGEYSDAVMTTARRTADSTPNDQVLVVCRRENLSLERTSEWDTLGFRGTCSPGFMLRSEGPRDMILETPYADVSAQTMLPVSHLMWGSVWLGIATEAMSRARKYVQSAARKTPGVTPPGALRLAEATAVLNQFSSLVHDSIARYERADADELAGAGFAVAMNTVKISCSTLVVDLVGRALLITGISGYREDSPYSLGRLLRDAYGAALMVNNDRILGNTAQQLLIAREQ